MGKISESDRKPIIASPGVRFRLLTYYVTKQERKRQRELVSKIEPVFRGFIQVTFRVYMMSKTSKFFQVQPRTDPLIYAAARDGPELF